MSGINLPRFRKALAAHSRNLPAGTYWRYSNGILPPPFGQLLVNNPELARALADDAAALATERNPSVAGEGSAAALA